MDKFKRILQFCGACIAFYIGAGFATMQEVMQYEASYGSEFWVVIAVCAVIYVYTNLSFISNGCLLYTSIHDLLDNYESRISDYEHYRSNIRKEKQEFVEDAKDIFQIR